MEKGRKEEKGPGAEEEGKAKKEGTPPRGRRARKREQGRHDLWYDEGDQTKTSEPKKGRHEELYHTTRTRNAPGLHKPPDSRGGLERADQRGMPRHHTPVRGEARAQLRDLEAGIPQGSHGSGRAGPEGPAAPEVRRVRSVQGAGRDQRRQRQQGDEDAGDEPDGLPVPEARPRGEALPVRQRLQDEEGDAGTAHTVRVHMVQAHKRRRRRRDVRADAVPSEAAPEGREEAASRQDGAGEAHPGRQARGREEAQQVRALRDGHHPLVHERNRRAAGAHRQEEPQVRHRAHEACHAGGGCRGTQEDGPAQGARTGPVPDYGQRMRVPRPGQDQGGRRMQGVLHARVRLVGEGIGRELQQARAQVVPEGNGLRQVYTRRHAQARERHQLHTPKGARRQERLRIRHGIRQGRITEKDKEHETIRTASKTPRKDLQKFDSLHLQFTPSIFCKK